MALSVAEEMCIRDRRCSNVLLAGTGALMSPMSLQQGDAIVGIAHLVWLSADGGAGPS